MRGAAAPGRRERDVHWWTCPLCFDRMRTSADTRAVERDRDAHLERAHPGVTVAVHLLRVSYWPSVGVG